MIKCVVWNKSKKELIEKNVELFTGLYENVNHIYEVEDECDEYYYILTETQGIIGVDKKCFKVSNYKRNINKDQVNEIDFDWENFLYSYNIFNGFQLEYGVTDREVCREINHTILIEFLEDENEFLDIQKNKECTYCVNLKTLGSFCGDVLIDVLYEAFKKVILTKED